MEHYKNRDNKLTIVIKPTPAAYLVDLIFYKVISWSLPIVNEQDLGYRLQFPALLTYHYACDMTVVRMLQTKGFGNSSTQQQKNLTSNFSVTGHCPEQSNT